jgi:uncharacterized protein (UPF0276 family)
MRLPPRFGVGFRRQHFADLLAAPRAVDWLEILSDNYLRAGGERRAMLERLRGEWPMALHGVSLSIASDAGPRADYLAQLRTLADRIDPLFVSDHLCWTGLGGVESHDLLPVAYTREVLALVCERVERVQDALGRRLLLENASAYVAFRGEELGEAEFFRELCARTGCGMLLDVNNLFVNAQNLGLDPQRYLDALEPDAIGYLHLAGHAVLPDVRVDTHASDVPHGVWDLYAEVVRRFPHAHVMLERDDAIPALAELVRELEQARALWRGAASSEPGRAPRGADPAVERAPLGERSREASPPWPSLREAFWQRVAGGGPASEGGELHELLDPTRPVAAARGLRVYADAFRETPRRALAAHFATLARAIGEREFSALAAAYLAEHPSRSHDYVALGARFADFVRRYPFEADFGVERATLAELAALEQAQLEVQEAPDEEPRVDADVLRALSAQDWERVRFEFVSASRVVRASHDVLPAIRAAARGTSPPRPRRAASAWLVTRPHGVACTDRIEARAAEILDALVRGLRFADACGSEADVTIGIAALGLACARGALRALRVDPARELRGDLEDAPGIEAA